MLAKQRARRGQLDDQRVRTPGPDPGDRARATGVVVARADDVHRGWVREERREARVDVRMQDPQQRVLIARSRQPGAVAQLHARPEVEGVRPAVARDHVAAGAVVYEPVAERAPLVRKGHQHAAGQPLVLPLDRVVGALRVDVLDAGEERELQDPALPGLRAARALRACEAR